MAWLGCKVEPDERHMYLGPIDILCDYTVVWNSNRTPIKRNNEDETLLSLYNGIFIVHDGHRIPLAEKKEQLKANGSIYRLMAPYGKNGKAVECEKCDATVLNSGDVYVFLAKGGQTVYTWLGHGSNDVEKEFAARVVD